MSDLRRLWGYGAHVRVRLLVAMLLGMCASGAAIGLTATAAFLISKASLQPPILTLSVAIVGVRFFGITRGVARYAERLVGHDAAFGVLSSLRSTVYGRLERLAPTGLPLYRSGDLLSRFVSDVDTSQELFLRVVPPYAIALILAVLTCSFLAWVLPAAGIICAVGLLLAALLVPRISAAASHHADRAVAADRSAISSQTLQLLDAMPELLVSGTSDRESGKVASAYTELRRTESRLARGLGVGSGLSFLLLGLTVIGCLAVGSDAVNDGRMDGVLLAVIVLTPLAAFDLTSPLPAAYQQWLRIRGAADRVFEIVDSPVVVVEPATARETPKEPFEIVLSGVDVRWPGALGPTVHGLSFSVKPGERIALVGPSGSGKSTTAALMVGFLRSDVGVMRWNDVSVAEYNTDDMRTRVGLLTQDGYIFDSTIEENLRIGYSAASVDEMTEALRRAQLLEWVQSLPDGLATAVGEHGTQLSGGQRQRLCLARLLLANFSVMVFDEPGEHLDTATADALMADLLEVTAGRTSILITHRLSGLAAVDRILVMMEGRIVEYGSHDQLVGGGGWYADNWRHEQAETTKLH